MRRITDWFRFGLRRTTESPGLADDRGGTLLEFAFASTMFLMTVFGTFELGLAVWRYNMISNLAQEGARWAAVRGEDSDFPASAADVTTFINTRANNVPITSVTVTSASSGSGPCTATAVNPSALSAGQAFCVTVRSSYLPLTGFIRTGNLSLTSTAKMVIQR